MMSKEEFKARRNGEIEGDVEVEQEQYTPVNMPIRDFIMNRVTEVFNVPIIGPDGIIEIEIRARLSKKETKEHANFLKIFTEPDNIEDDVIEASTARFLAAITTDKDLDEEFWACEDIDPYITQELVLAFLKKAADTIEQSEKFR